jgi:hypothetical protein
MPLVRGTQVLDGSVKRVDLDAATPGEAVIRRILAGIGITLASTGPDAGTGDVTINAAAPTNSPAAGRMITPAAQAAAAGSFATVANTIYAIPIQMRSALNFSSIKCDVFTGVAANLRMAVYRSLDALGNYPGALIAGSDPLVQPANAAGPKTNTVSFSVAANEVVWVCFQASAAITMRSYPGTTIPADILGAISTAGFTIGNAYSFTQAFAAFPANFPSGQSPVFLANYPIVGLTI